MGMLNLPVVRPRRVVFNPRDYPHINDLPQFRIRDINELVTRCFKLPKKLGNRSESLIRSELEDYFSRLLGVRDASRLIELKVDADDPALQLALKHAYKANKRPSEFDEVRRFVSDVVEPRRNSIYVGNCNRPSAYGTYALLGNIHYGTLPSAGSLSDDSLVFYDNVIVKCSTYCNNCWCVNASTNIPIGVQTASYNNGTSIYTVLASTNYYPISSWDIPQSWGIQYAPYVYSTNPLTLIMYGSWTASSSWTKNYILIGVARYQSNCYTTLDEPVFYAYNSNGFSVSNGVSYISEWEIIYA
jgi:hypothetical protein